ncbi:MAG: hypothetical protein D6769_00925 [Methanobacteriota archaeon]|nr:MAG: hypothetical protein D6769_00925 [Euryarchaeota archaeon]
MKGLLLHVKDKQFYTEEEGNLRLVGNIGIVKKLSKEYKLLHLIDRALERGSLSNYDMYDAISRIMYSQVECTKKEIAAKLQEIHVRAVMLPPYEGIGELDVKYLAARVDDVKDLHIADRVRDIVTSNREVAEELGESNRLFFIGDFKGAFCTIDIKKLRFLNNL